MTDPVAWDLAAAKPAFTAAGRYTPPALMGPDRQWLVAMVDDNYLNVLDAATGECRGRFGGETGCINSLEDRGVP